MSELLIKQLRKARQRTVTVDKFTFTVRRPTDIEFVDASKMVAYDIVRDYVVGWSGVTEADIIRGGAEDEVPFDMVLWHEWAADRPDLWEPIFEAVLAAYQQHSAARQDATKNSLPGSNLQQEGNPGQVALASASSSMPGT